MAGRRNGKKKQDGAEPMTIVSLAAPDDLISRIDGYRGSLDVYPSLSSACRRLIEHGLEVGEMSRRRSLEECRDILNEREYLFDVRGGREEGEWEITDVNPNVLFNGFDSLTPWEANAIVRAFLLDDAEAARKEATRG